MISHNPLNASGWSKDHAHYGEGGEVVSAIG